MHGHFFSTNVALVGLVVAVLALIIQILAFRREK
jgi:hypothetical protein